MAPLTDDAAPEDTRAWEHDAELTRLLDHPSTPIEVTRDTRRIVVRMHGGEDVELGRTDNREEAVKMARDAVRAIEASETSGEWPLVGERFLRPGAIVSIDVQRASF